jgi:hypothetical protein
MEVIWNMEGEFHKLLSNFIDQKHEDYLFAVLEDARKEFPIKKSPVFTSKNIINVLIWFDKWFGTLEKKENGTAT